MQDHSAHKPAAPTKPPPASKGAPAKPTQPDPHAGHDMSKPHPPATPQKGAHK